MRRKVAILVLFIAVVLTGCGRNSEERVTRSDAADETTANMINSTNIDETSPDKIDTGVKGDDDTTEKSRILIVYFTRADNVKQDDKLDAVSSASITKNGDTIIGNMKIMADYIKETTGGEEFSIKTELSYSQDYDETTDQAKKEQQDDTRPKLISQVENMEEYDIIFLGYPNWWGTIPMPVFSFLESYDFTGKTIIPFCSHEGSGLGSGVSDIEKLCPDSVILEGLAICGSKVNESKNDITEWIDSLGILK